MLVSEQWLQPNTSTVGKSLKRVRLETKDEVLDFPKIDPNTPFKSNGESPKMTPIGDGAMQKFSTGDLSSLEYSNMGSHLAEDLFPMVEFHRALDSSL